MGRKTLNDTGGHLEVGTSGRGEVVVNHPMFQLDARGVGHVVFSPDQARVFAALLIKHSATAAQEVKPRGAKR